MASKNLDKSNILSTLNFTIPIYVILREIGLDWKLSAGNLPSIRQKNISSICLSLENDTLHKTYLAYNVLTVDNFLYPTLIACNEIFLLLKTKLQICKLWFMFSLFLFPFLLFLFGCEIHFTTHFIYQKIWYLTLTAFLCN